MKLRFLVVLVSLTKQLSCDNFASINLPPEHLPYYFTAFPSVAAKCQQDPECPYKDYTQVRKYWGYEAGNSGQYSTPECPGYHKGWVKSTTEQVETFYNQGDFGFVKQQLREMKLMCEPLFADDSVLECSDHLRYCRGRNLMVNFTKLSTIQEPIRYNMNVLSEGDIGGYCELKKDSIDEQADHISALQSWGPEMRYFTKLPIRPIQAGLCDVVIEKPTYIMKIDATVNMYHHFCDFFNLYASLHLNNQPNAFSTDVHVLIWETFNYRSPFQDTWKAFTEHPLWDLKSFRGKTVCFKNVVFPLLPRMIFGLYYNTPLIYGCKKSGLFHAFSKHILHRLKVPVHPRVQRKIRVTFLSRDTKFRRVLNEDQLVEAMNDEEEYEVKRVVFNKDVPFKKQLEISANTDILVGIHGAGLTHLLFLPDWASVFELYNCEDPNCYADLSRLRGLNYITWRDTSKLSSDSDAEHKGEAHAKFVNYLFDVQEFKMLLGEAADLVRNHPDFVVQEKDSELEHDEL